LKKKWNDFKKDTVQLKMKATESRKLRDCINFCKPERFALHCSIHFVFIFVGHGFPPEGARLPPPKADLPPVEKRSGGQGLL